MKYFILLLLTMFSSSLLCQEKWDYNWMIGTQNGNPAGDGSLISFKDGIVSIQYIQKEMNMHTDNATVSDGDGNLLFYTNGCYIANKENAQMPNGNNLNPGSVHTNFCANGYPVSQGVLAFPSIEDENIFYIVHESAANASLSDFLYYTRVDMEGDDGLGDVIEKNIVVIEDSLWQGYLTATRHANGTSWWIIAGGYHPDQYYKLLLDSSGIWVHDFQDLDIVGGQEGWGVGQAVFSPDGTKYVHYNRNEQALLFGFDRGTGQISYQQQLFVDSTIYFGGAAISPNNRFLYVSNAIYLYQFDLEAPDIQGSKVLIDTFDGFSSPFPANFYLMQLGPDCRIYMSTGNGTDRLHVINFPNQKGQACGFHQHAIQLPKDNFSTIPNNPNYRLGTGYPVCDSSIQLVVSSVNVLPPPVEVQVYPNPASGSITIAMPRPLPAGSRWSLYSAVGQRVLSHKMERGTSEVNISLSGVPPGLYFWELRSEGGGLPRSGKVVVSE